MLSCEKVKDYLADFMSYKIDAKLEEKGKDTQKEMLWNSPKYTVKDDGDISIN